MPVFDFAAGDLTRLRRLSYSARLPAMTRREGQHRCRRAGEGIEFLDYRPYVPGDDLRHIDWGLYGRLRQLFVRVFEAAENLWITILVDLGRSMTFGHPVSKAVHACRIACGLSYVALARGERLRVGYVADQLAAAAGPFQRTGDLGAVVQYLHRAPEGGPTDLAGCVRAFCQQLRQRGLVIVISDFLGGAGRVDDLALLLSRGCSLLLVHVIDPADAGAGIGGYLRLRDSETGEERVLLVDENVRQAVRRAAQAHGEALAAWCRRYGQSYTPARTRDDFLEIVCHALRWGIRQR